MSFVIFVAVLTGLGWLLYRLNKSRAERIASMDTYPSPERKAPPQLNADPDQVARAGQLMEKFNRAVGNDAATRQLSADIRTKPT